MAVEVESSSMTSSDRSVLDEVRGRVVSGSPHLASLHRQNGLGFECISSESCGRVARANLSYRDWISCLAGIGEALGMAGARPQVPLRPRAGLRLAGAPALASRRPSPDGPRSPR